MLYIFFITDVIGTFKNSVRCPQRHGSRRKNALLLFLLHLLGSRALCVTSKVVLFAPIDVCRPLLSVGRLFQNFDAVDLEAVTFCTVLGRVEHWRKLQFYQLPALDDVRVFRFVVAPDTAFVCVGGSVGRDVGGEVPGLV